MATRYVPLTEKTKKIYSKLLATVKRCLPPGACDDNDSLQQLTEDVVGIALDRNITPQVQKQKLSDVFDTLSPADLNLIVELCELLTDFVGAVPTYSLVQGDNEIGVTADLDIEASHSSGSDDGSEDVSNAFSDDGTDDVKAAIIPFAAIARNADYIGDRVRSLLPTMTPTECQIRAERVLAFLKNRDANDMQVETQLNALLCGNSLDDEGETAVMDWITAATENRWTLVYGSLYANASNQLEKNAVMSELELHAAKEHSVEILYQQITGKEVGGTGADAATASSWATCALKLVDIEGSYLGDGAASHRMRVKPSLPAGTKVKKCEFQGTVHWDETILPACKTFDKQMELKKISEMPAWAQEVFDVTKMKGTLNPMQSIVFQCAFETDLNMLVCAPTGAGKTNVALTTMLRCIENHRDPVTGKFDTENFKMVYIAPMTALVREVVQTFSRRLECLGMSVVECTGDSQATFEEIRNATLIVATPEKWDVVTRKSMELGIAALIRLMVIDEVHLLHNDRGPVLESIVARIHTTEKHTGVKVRLVGLSATLPNFEDVAAFLRVDKTAGKGLFPFDASFRPVPLQQTFCSVNRSPGINPQTVLNKVTYAKVMEHARQKPVMVFVHSRKDTEYTANFIRKEAELDKALIRDIQRPGSDSERIVKERLAELGDLIRDSLRQLVLKGFGIHHKGLDHEEKKLVEELFRDGHMRVLVSTSTLAWGVNLPAHSVIIKGTRVYNPRLCKTSNISFLDVLQMFGRAGRSDYDTSGVACLLTTEEDLFYYLGILTAKTDIESQFMKRLIDVLNAEIALGHIKTIVDGVLWLQQTYFYVRMKKKPQLYGAPSPAERNDPLYHRYLSNLIHSAAEHLKRHKMISYSSSSRQMSPLDAGRIASHFYINYKSMSVYQETLAPVMHDVELFRLFSASDEFSNISVREEEKDQLEQLLLNCPIAVREDHHNPLAKINVLLQCYISCMTLEGTALMSELVYIKDSAQRILRALHELALCKGYGITAHAFLDLYLMGSRRQWAHVQTPLRQLPITRMNVGSTAVDEIFRALEGRTRDNWDHVRALSIEDLESSMRMRLDYATAAHRAMQLVPKYILETTARPFTHNSVRLDIDVTPDFEFDSTLHTATREMLLTVEAQSAGGKVLHSELFSFPVVSLAEQRCLSLVALVPIPTRSPTHLFVRLTSTSWLGCHYRIAVPLIGLKIPQLIESAQLNSVKKERTDDEEQFAIRKILDPYGIDLSVAEKLFPFENVNSAQFEVADAVLGGCTNLFVAMPPGTGKGFLGDLFILSFLMTCAKDTENGEKFGLLYLTMNEQAAARRFEEFHARYGAILNQRVTAISGTDIEKDSQAIASSNIVVCTGGQLLSLVRRCHPCLAKFTHILLDHLHTLRSSSATNYECAISRLITKPLIVGRPVPTQKAIAPRILALSYTLASPFELCTWLKIPKDGIFNFGDRFRHHDAEIIVQPVDSTSYHSRFQQCRHQVLKFFEDPHSKSASDHILSRSHVIVFVPTARDAMECAFDLDDKRFTRRQAAEQQEEEENTGDGQGKKKMAKIHINLLMQDVSDAPLAQLLSRGVGYFTTCTSKQDELLMLSLPILEDYRDENSEEIKLVLFASFDTAYQFPASVFEYAMIVLPERMLQMEKRADEAMFVRDCEIAEILQMATRGKGKVHLYCRKPLAWMYKTFLTDPLPLESSMTHYSDFSDTVNAAVAQGRVKTVADVTRILQSQFYFFEHLKTNPNFYDPTISSRDDIGRFLSTLADDVLQDLVNTGCCAQPNDAGTVAILPVGLFAAFHCVSCETVGDLSEKISLKETPTILSMLRLVCETKEVQNLSSCRWSDKTEKMVFEHLASVVLPLKEVFGMEYFNISKRDWLRLKPFLLMLCHLSPDVVTTGADSSKKISTLKQIQQKQLRREISNVVPLVVLVTAAAVEVANRKSFACARRLMHLHQCMRCQLWHTHASRSPLMELPALRQHQLHTLAKSWTTQFNAGTIFELLSGPHAPNSLDSMKKLFTGVTPAVSPAAQLAVLWDLSAYPLLQMISAESAIEELGTDLVFVVVARFKVAAAASRQATEVRSAILSMESSTAQPGEGAATAHRPPSPTTSSLGCWVCCFNSNPGHDQAFALRRILLDVVTETLADGSGQSEKVTEAVLRFPLSDLGDGSTAEGGLKVAVVLEDYRLDFEMDVSLPKM